MEDKILAARRLRIEHVVDSLMEIYNMGVDYIDLYGILKENDGDEVVLSFCKEYMNNEYKNDFEKIFQEAVEEDGQVTRKLTDDDINNLI